jgi:hypothetical protein
MLVGYPLDGSMAGVNVMPGQMYEAGPSTNALTADSAPVVDQQVYTGSWFAGFPGNSGGPFYVQLNDHFYPAGVYLGSLSDGRSAVRGIDSNVVNLINLAATFGDDGMNHGGGVILLVPSGNVSGNNFGLVTVQIGPAAAVAAGAAWKITNDLAYSTSPSYVRNLTTTNQIALLFKPIPGWNLPASQTVQVQAGGRVSANANYSVIGPKLVVNAALKLGLIGTTNTSYRIEQCTSIKTGDWAAIITNTIAANGFNLLVPQPANAKTAFYRAVWLP